MRTHSQHHTGQPWNRILAKTLLIATMVALLPVARAEDTVTNTPDQTSAASTSNSADPPRNNIMNANDTGVAVNGDVKGSNVNNNQNNLSTGSNTNLNLVAPNVVTPTQSLANGGAASGGNSVLMLPRNPLPLPNAMLGRSNFGLQFGLQNNPILGQLGNLNGNQNALGWFMQAGLTIPFGKIPEVLNNPQNTALDEMRQRDLANRRNLFGTPNQVDSRVNGDTIDIRREVNGRVAGLGAYNYATIPSSKIAMPDSLANPSLSAVAAAQTKLVALEPAEVYSKPLNIGEKIGVIEAGSEYPYLGHTRSGWVKILMPNGTEGWASTHFEYVKNDFTEIDSLALDPSVTKREKTALQTPSVGISPKTEPRKVGASVQ